MRDIPLFTAAAGIAALTLSEIPYKGEAYIRLLDSSDPKMLLDECCDFCHAAGAEHIYATGHDILGNYPFHTAVLEMSRLRAGLADTDAALFPVQHQNLELWRQIYNDRMRNIPNAATMTSARAEKILQEGNGYFIHRGDELLGIGIASGETIDAIVSVVDGAGESVLLALNHALSADRIVVEVASENIRAVNLYKRLGFVTIEEISKWYRVI